LTPICFHFNSLPSGRVLEPSAAFLPNFSSTPAKSLELNTQVSHPPPASAFFFTAWPNGVASVAG